MFGKYTTFSENTERVWVGVGSNLLDPKKQVMQAIQSLSRLPMTKLIVYSSLYRSIPLGIIHQNQPDFLNLVVVLDTNLSPDLFLSYIQYIEQLQGRCRDPLVRWRSRTLDLDILLFGKNVIHTDRLIVPHYDMFRREFIMYPLLELDDSLLFPNGKCIKEIIQSVPKNNLISW